MKSSSEAFAQHNMLRTHLIRRANETNKQTAPPVDKKNIENKSTKVWLNSRSKHKWKLKYKRWQNNCFVAMKRYGTHTHTHTHASNIFRMHISIFIWRDLEIVYPDCEFLQLTTLRLCDIELNEHLPKCTQKQPLTTCCWWANKRTSERERTHTHTQTVKSKIPAPIDVAVIILPYSSTELTICLHGVFLQHNR